MRVIWEHTDSVGDTATLIACDSGGMVLRTDVHANKKTGEAGPTVLVAMEDEDVARLIDGLTGMVAK